MRLLDRDELDKKKKKEIRNWWILLKKKSNLNSFEIAWKYWLAHVCSVSWKTNMQFLVENNGPC